MDTITHGIVGALIGKAFFAEDLPRNAPSWREAPRTAARVAILSATIGAIFPDIDVLAGPLAHNALAMLTWHRNITHSLVMLPIWAVALAVLTNFLAQKLLRWPVPAFSSLVLIYAVSLGSHIFLDLITSFGTMIWSPLDYTRPSWDWVFIIDLMVTSAALVPQLAAWVFRRPEGAPRRSFACWGALSAVALGLGPLVRLAGVPYTASTAALPIVLFGALLVLPLRRDAGVHLGRTNWSRVGIAFLGTYLSFAGSMHSLALSRVQEFATESRISAENIAALPQPPSAANWVGMIATRTGTYRIEFGVFGDEPVKIQYFTDPPDNSAIAAARSLRDVQTFLWFARFPVFHYLERDGQQVVQISDLSFYGPGRQGTPGSATPPSFTFQVVFKPDGSLVSDGLLLRP
jgi:membrane-bound metal-dependent hydrolase YbcI (DUF457 family)